MKIESMISAKLGKAQTGAAQQVELVCRRAKELEEVGEYESARAAMAPFWQRIGERPRVEGRSALERADVFLRAGTLSGWIGSAQQITGAQ